MLGLRAESSWFSRHGDPGNLEHGMVNFLSGDGSKQHNQSASLSPWGFCIAFSQPTSHWRHQASRRCVADDCLSAFIPQNPLCFQNVFPARWTMKGVVLLVVCSRGALPLEHIIVVSAVHHIPQLRDGSGWVYPSTGCDLLAASKTSPPNEANDACIWLPCFPQRSS